MNILVLSETYYPNYGGAELATHLYSKLLSDRGINVSVITNRHKGEEEISKAGNYTVYRLNLFRNKVSSKYSILSRVDVFFTGFFKRMLNWADLVYIPRLWFSAIPFVKRLKKPVLVHLHDYFPVCPLSNMFDFSTNKLCDGRGSFCSPKCILAYERSKNLGDINVLLSLGLNSLVGGNYGKLIDFSDAIICVSKEHKRLLVDRYADLGHKTYHIYNPLPEISEISMESYDFGFFGGRNPLKGYRILHKALKKVKGIGGGKVRVHATMFPDLNRLLDYPNVDFIPYGRLGIDEFHSLYRKVGTVIVPSIWPEPLPYVVLEALIRGRLLIASEIGGIPEEVDGCKGVILCEPGNFDALSEAMDRVIGSSKEDVLEWRIHNNKLINDRFNDKESIDKFVHVCDKII